MNLSHEVNALQQSKWTLFLPWTAMSAIVRLM